ncbi:hypothetical protein MAR_019783 [Mya arenaria]|uniref:Tryptophan-rich sensory protein n=1 Tax=Mya arenaria TaxID=6604 RepID=A0ABY7E7M0_MYAAR|nr:hypothetical protein MAR_019783 [Mya arenaria]
MNVSNPKNNMARHSVPKIVLIIATIVVFALTAAFNGLAAAGNGGGVFNNRTGDISDAFYLEVTPAGWTFTIWGFIYAWQAAWLVYALVTICRRKVGTYVYLMPVFPSVLFFAYIFNNVSNVAWLFAWDQMKLAIALPLIALTPLTLFVCLYFSFKTLYDNPDYLIRNGAIADIWLIRLLIQNGIAFYAAWVTVATFINVALVMTYKNGDLVNTAVPQDVSSTVFLSVVLVVIVVWFSLDMSFLDKYTRYTFAPYITWTVALAGIISKNYDLDTAYRNSIISVVVQAVAATCLVVKIPVMIWRHFKRPIQPLLSDFKPTV